VLLNKDAEITCFTFNPQVAASSKNLVRT